MATSTALSKTIDDIEYNVEVNKRHCLLYRQCLLLLEKRGASYWLDSN